MSRVEITPLRSWNDFFPGSDRFAKPDFSNLAKWNNRVVNNLLYYQTNYLVMAIVVFLAVGLLNPVSMVLGGTVVTLVFLGSVWASENKAVVKNFKKQNPMLFVIAMMVISYLLLSFVGGVMVFLFGITFPLLLIIVHASLRLRNVKNKLENRIEGAGLKTSPMGVVLESLGQQGDSLNTIQDFLENRLKE